ncbi:integrase, catalytic region [Syntrophomonas wolfei subsp. wolfei str. Goettingen G311]|uniref:Integrase, catalytic region n=1 Tax=Syntrophomonas wolfei subsp. wolfei (strain DSM 2245B / Goettingen) TaxID=335541 RepID=Q0AU06_SYNWW|nr:integrase, catalytic region [Syntrophomonas wolfei subsp. wolfei str. Goettingen G311]
MCKEIGILRPQRVLKPYRPGQIGHKRKAIGPNEHWEIDLKYGYIKGISQFFYQISIIDIFDRTIVENHIGLSAKAKDAARIVQIAAKKRGIKPDQLVIRSDNGPQFRAKAFT